MDHTHQIQGSAAIAGIRVPFVCNNQFQFDSGDFYTYAFRCGMIDDPETSSVTALNLQEKSIDELAPFLQAWLFFGTLHTLFQVQAKTEYEWTDFVERHPSGEVLVTTEMLSMYIWCWAAYESAIPLDEMYGASSVSSLLQAIDAVTASLVRDDRKNSGSFAPRSDSVDKWQSPGHRVLLSIIVLAETLRIAGREIHEAQQAAYQPRFSSIFSTLLSDRLQCAGWCPWQIERLELDSNMDCLTVYVLSMIDQTSLGKDHTRCSVDKCYGNDVDYDTYQSKHRVQGCNCAFVPQTDDNVSLCVSWILDEGGLPLLSLTDTGNDSEAMLNTNQERIPRYVAVSHVWSDGLGNQERNAMPLCTLRMIQKRVNSLYEDSQRPVLFWIDTICVPKTNKIPALEAMLQTYKNAEIVLVIDASLEPISIATPPQERLLRIRMSPWMQRLWTLQEGWVANSLAFQFSEAACWAKSLIRECEKAPNPLKLSIEQLLHPEKRGAQKKLGRHIDKLIRALAVKHTSFEMPEDKMVSLREQLEAGIPGYPKEEDHRLARLINRSHLFDSVFRDATTTLLSLENQDMTGSFHTQHLGLVFNALKNRTTSRLEDEMYCVANLLKLPVTPILVLEPERRMKKLLSLMPQVPASVIFSHQFMRMEDEGFSWAPKTFMSIHAVSYDSGTLGRVEGGGLRCSLPGLRIRRPPVRHDGKWHASNRPDESQTHRIKVAMLLNSERWLYNLAIFHPPSHPPTTWNDFDGMDLMVILRRTIPDRHGRVVDTVDGAVVSLISEDGHIRRVKFLIVVWMERSGVTLTEDSTLGCYTGEWLDDDCEWCIM